MKIYQDRYYNIVHKTLLVGDIQYCLSNVLVKINMIFADDNNANWTCSKQIDFYRFEYLNKRDKSPIKDKAYMIGFHDNVKTEAKTMCE